MILSWASAGAIVSNVPAAELRPDLGGSRMLATRRLIVAALVAGGALVATSLPAAATTATATVTGGTLGFVTAPANTGFTVSLTGRDVVATATQTFDIGDATG